MAGEIEARLKALDLVLPEVASPVADYVSFLHLDRLLLVSGQLPLADGKLAFAGKVGADLDLITGQAAARLCAVNILAQAKAALRDLDRIVQLLRLTGLCQRPARLYRASESDQRRVGPDGRGPRQQGAPYPHCRRLRESSARRRG